jgi:hypothetical protein
MKKKGAALLTVVIVTSVIFVLAVTVLDRSIRVYRDTMDLVDEGEVYYTAESLAYDMLGYLDTIKISAKKDCTFDENSGGFKHLESDYTGNFTVSLISWAQLGSGSPVDGYVYNIESKVTYKEADYIVRMQVEAAYSGNKFIGHRLLERKTFKYTP